MQNYKELCVVGSGAFGIVTKCHDIRCGKIVAIKKHVYSKTWAAKMAIRREYSLLWQVPHANIVTLLDVFHDNGYLYGVFEYFRHSVYDEMCKHRCGPDQQKLRVYIYQLLRAVDFLHQHNIIHRDIKPDNLLVSQWGLLKLADFGSACRLVQGPKLLSPVRAARGFSSPELLLEDIYGKPADVWAIGCCILFMANWPRYFVDGMTDQNELWDIIRKVGPLTQCQEQLYFQVYGHSAVLPINTRQHASVSDKYGLYDKDLAVLVDACLQMEPADRPSCSDLMLLEYFTKDDFPGTFTRALPTILQREDVSLQTSFKEHEEVGEDTSSQDVMSAPCTTPTVPRKEKKSKMGIKATLSRAFQRVNRVFSRKVKPEGTENKVTSQMDRPVEEPNHKSLAKVPGIVHEGGAEEPGIAHEGGAEKPGIAHEGGAEEPGIAHEGGAEEPGIVHEGGAEEPGIAHEGGAEEPGIAHEGGAEAPGIVHEGGAEAPGIVHEGGAEAPGIVHEGGAEKPGITHEGGAEAPGIVHEGGAEEPGSTNAGGAETGIKKEGLWRRWKKYCKEKKVLTKCRYFILGLAMLVFVIIAIAAVVVSITFKLA